MGLKNRVTAAGKAGLRGFAGTAARVFMVLMILSLVWSAIPNFAAAQTEEALAASQRGFQLRQQNKFTEAIAAYKEAVAADPNFANAWWGLGNAYYYNNQKQAALNAYDRFLQLSPDDTKRAQFVESLRSQVAAAAPAAKPKPAAKPAAKPAPKPKPAPSADMGMGDESGVGDEMGGDTSMGAGGTGDEFGAGDTGAGDEYQSSAPRASAKPKPAAKPAPAARQPEQERPRQRFEPRAASDDSGRQYRPGGFLISFGFASVPMRWQYLQATHRHTVLSANGHAATQSDNAYAAKEEKFRMGVVTIRGAKMFEVLKNFCAGLEAGLAFPLSKKKFQFASATRVANSQQDFIVPSDYSDGASAAASVGGIVQGAGGTTFGVDFSTFGATTLDVEMKAFFFPLMAKLQYSFPFGPGNYVDVGAAFGGYVYTARATFKGGGFNVDGTAATVKKEFRQISVVPAAELNAGVSLRIHKNIDVMVNLLAAYSAKAYLGTKAGGYEESSVYAKTSLDGASSSLAYKNGMVIGGLGFGGNAGVNLHF